MKTLLALILVVCGSFTARSKTNDELDNPFRDLRVRQVELKTYDAATGSLEWLFKGPHELKPGTSHLLAATRFLIEKDGLIQAAELDYFKTHFHDKEWVLTYECYDNGVILAQQTSQKNTYPYAWWQGLRIKPVSVTGLTGLKEETVTCDGTLTTFTVVKDWTMFTINPDSHSVQRVSRKEFTAGEWIFTYQQSSGWIVQAHKPYHGPWAKAELS